MADRFPQTGQTVLALGSAAAAATNNVTLPSAAGVMTYITSLTITGGGATAASVVTVTITGLVNALTYQIPVPAGAAAGILPVVIVFPDPLPASGPNIPIVVNVPSFGAGNTNAAVAVTGFQRPNVNL